MIGYLRFVTWVLLLGVGVAFCLLLISSIGLLLWLIMGLIFV